MNGIRRVGTAKGRGTPGSWWWWAATSLPHSSTSARHLGVWNTRSNPANDSEEAFEVDEHGEIPSCSTRIAASGW